MHPHVVFRRLARTFACGTLVGLLAACGDDGTTNPDNSAGSLSAKIDGSDFSGTLGVQATQANGVIAIAAQDNSVRQIQLRALGISAPGSVGIGAGSVSFASVSQGANLWSSNLVLGTGSITFTTLSSTRAVGTFTFSAIATPGTSATGTKTVSSGAFDVKF